MSDAGVLSLGVRVAHEAGALLLERFGKVRAVATKSSPTDLVSEADRESEDLIIRLIRSERPDDGIVSEEGGRERGTSGLRWVIDPLDGTVNYLFGLPIWAVSIAVNDDLGGLAGVVFDPCRKETFSALRGSGARLNGVAIGVSDRDDLGTAMIGTGFSYDAEARAAQARRIPSLLPLVRDIRRAGSAALDLAWVSCGRLDGFFEAPMQVWDRAAGEVLVREGGGVVTPLSPPFGDSTGVVAAGPRLHSALEHLVLKTQ